MRKRKKDDSSEEGNVKQIIDVFKRLDRGQKEWWSEDRRVDSDNQSSRQMRGTSLEWSEPKGKELK